VQADKDFEELKNRHLGFSFIKVDTGIDKLSRKYFSVKVPFLCEFLSVVRA